MFKKIKREQLLAIIILFAFWIVNFLIPTLVIFPRLESLQRVDMALLLCAQVLGFLLILYSFRIKMPELLLLPMLFVVLLIPGFVKGFISNLEIPKENRVQYTRTNGSTDQIASLGLCFDVYIPLYLARTEKNIDVNFHSFDVAEGKCDTQLIQINYDNSPIRAREYSQNYFKIKVYEVDKSYDFDYRYGYEDLKNWYEAVVGLEPISQTDDYSIYHIKNVYGKESGNEMLFLEKNNTLVFIEFRELASGITLQEYVKFAESF